MDAKLDSLVETSVDISNHFVKDGFFLEQIIIETTDDGIQVALDVRDYTGSDRDPADVYEQD
jgi:hypothetical protein